MNATLFLDALLTVLLSLALVGAGAVSLCLLPWTDADRAGTARGLAAVVRAVAQASVPKADLGEGSGRARRTFRAVPAR